MAFVPLQLPQLLDVTTMEEPQFYGDYVPVSYTHLDVYKRQALQRSYLVVKPCIKSHNTF